MTDKPIISGLRVVFKPDRAADAYLSRVAMVTVTTGRHPDAADAALYLWTRTDYGATLGGPMAMTMLIDTSPAGIVSDARRYGFNAESDRRLYSGRVVPWELIDAAKALIDRTDNPLEDGHDQYAWIVSATDRLRRALKDL